MNAADRRSAERFIGAIPVELKQGRGLTRDFSTEGLYFETDQLVTVGEQIELVMYLEHSGVGNPLRLLCQGKVSRVEGTGALIGVAASIGGLRFVA